MKNKTRKITGSILSFALAASMVMGLSGMTTLAAESEDAAEEQTIIVKEQVNGTADTSFDFHICQITGANKPIETMGNITSSVPGSNLSYTIYDTNTAEALGTETTDENGTFSLSADEYAEFSVTAQTDWFVFQDTPDAYPLVSVTSEGSYASVVDSTNGVVQYAAESTPTTSVDKSALQEEYNTDALLNESDYTSASWAPFKEALDKAESVLNDNNATQEEVDEALANLKQAKEGLQEAEKADKTALQKEYDTDITLSEADYTPESWEPFEDAMNQAKKVLDDDDATQAEVDAALKTLQDAKEGLEKVAEPTPEPPGQPTVSVTVSSDLTNNTKTYDGKGVTLTAKATTDPDTAQISYQWYTVASDGTETAIEGATDSVLDIAGSVSDSGMYKCVVTATSDGLTATAEAAITITIEKAAQDISYAQTLVEKTVEDGSFTNDLTVTTLSDEDGAGITYTSSDTSVATVDAATGTVTIVAAGSSTITATAAATANYAEASAAYVVTITEAEPEPGPGPSPEPTVDKSALQAEYDTDSKLIEEQYTVASWPPFEEALEAAKEVLDNDDATQADVDAALSALQSAKGALEELTYPDISIVKYGEVVLTIKDADFKKLQSEAEEQTFTMNRNSGTSTEITAHFVLVTDLLGDCQPDEGCGVNFGTNWLDMDNLYIYYNASNQQYSIAVDQAVGNSGGWTGGITSITVGHAYEDGVCTICGAGEPMVTVKIDSSLAGQGNTKTYDGTGASLSATADVAFEEPYEVSYQWYKDGDAIEGATDAVYEVGPNVSDSGTYKCVVTATKDGLDIEGSSEVAITINPAAQEISYAVESLEKTTNDAPFTNELTVTTLSQEAGAGITYASSDSNIATVDENGEVTILAGGTVTITATAAATANYAEATASYTIKIEAQEHTHVWSVDWKWTGLPVYCTTDNADFEPLSVAPIQPWNVVESLHIATLSGDTIDATATATGTCTICNETETVDAVLTAEYLSEEPTEYVGALAQITATATFSDDQTATDEVKVLAPATGSIDVTYLNGEETVEPDKSVSYADINELINKVEPFTIHYFSSGGNDTALTMPFVTVKAALGMDEEQNVCCFTAHGTDGFNAILPADAYLYQRNNLDSSGKGYYYRTAVASNDTRSVHSSQAFVSYVDRIEVQYQHQWNKDAVWTWADDYSSATAYNACTRTNGLSSGGMDVCNYSETVDAEISSEIVGSNTVYTATATFVDGTVFTDTKTVPTPATGGVDKEALQKEYDVDSLITEADYDADSWAPFATALSEAEAVLANENATQEEVNAALDQLVEARKGLALKDGVYVADTAWYTDAEAGTTDFTIVTANQMVGLSDIVNGTATDSEGNHIAEDTFKDKTVELLDDVQMNPDGTVDHKEGTYGATATPVNTSSAEAQSFTPIGNMTFDITGAYAAGTYAFEGTFNGNGNTIKNLYIKSADGYLGLFGVVGGEKGEYQLGHLENFTITGVIECTGGSAGNELDFVGAACAKLNAGATIEYVTNYATIIAPYVDNVGGIVGFAGTPSELAGDYPTTNPSYNDNPSGYNTFVKCCGNEATILGYHKQGGIVGENAATVEYCYNNGWILARLTGSKCGMGGIAGRNSNNGNPVEQSVIAYCYNTGTISNDGHNDIYSGDQRDYAGIAGQNFGGRGENEIYNCYNRAVIPKGYSFYNSIASELDASSNYGYGAYVSIRNNYSTEAAFESSSSTDEQERGIERSEAWFKGAASDGELDVWTCLGPYFVADEESINEGYPVLWWQKAGAEEPTGTVVELSVAQGPDKTSYSVGDRFDPNGMEVIATYDNGTQELVLADYGEYSGHWYDRTQGFSISEAEQTLSQAGTASIDITYKGCTLNGAVSVTVN